MRLIHGSRWCNLWVHCRRGAIATSCLVRNSDMPDTSIMLLCFYEPLIPWNRKHVGPKISRYCPGLDPLAENAYSYEREKTGNDCEINGKKHTEWRWGGTSGRKVATAPGSRGFWWWGWRWLSHCAGWWARCRFPPWWWGRRSKRSRSWDGWERKLRVNLRRCPRTGARGLNFAWGGAQGGAPVRKSFDICHPHLHAVNMIRINILCRPCMGSL